jgi:hypothetical protein
MSSTMLVQSQTRTDTSMQAGGAIAAQERFSLRAIPKLSAASGPFSAFDWRVCFFPWWDEPGYCDAVPRAARYLVSLSTRRRW